MAKSGSRLSEVKEKYGLIDLDDSLWSKGYQINKLQEELHKELFKKNDITDQLNLLNLGVRLQETLIRSNLDDEDKSYLDVMRGDLKQITNRDVSKKFENIFERYDLIVDRLDETFTTKSYYAEENTNGGILSSLIANRIALHDQNFIVGFHGLPRSGKTKGAMRLGINTVQETSRLLKAMIDLTRKDWVYDKEQYLRRLQEREKEGSVKGSVLALEEAGDQLNSAKFWDEDVQGSVNILQQQGYQNTCLIIISQLHTDIVKKARGLLHCVLVPWKDLSKRTMEVDERQHIDFKKNLSYWKVDMLDIDPLTGEHFPKGIQVALGKVKKMGLLYPPKKLATQFDKIDHDYKRKRQDVQLIDVIIKKLKAGDLTKINEVARLVLADPVYQTKTGKVIRIRVMRKMNIGRTIADKIMDEIEEIQEKEEKEHEEKNKGKLVNEVAAESPKTVGESAEPVRQPQNQPPN